MWSDWIRGLLDREILYAKLIAGVDHVEEEGFKGAYSVAAAKAAGFATLVRRLLYTALIVSTACGVLWVVLNLAGLKEEWLYQMLLMVVGVAWGAFLVVVMTFLGLLQGLAKKFKQVQQVLADIQQSVIQALRLPAAVAFTILFLAVLVGRFPALRDPGAFAALLGLLAAFALASFLGWISFSGAWLKRFIAFQLFLALAVLLILPQFPHFTAYFQRHATGLKQRVGTQAAARRVVIDVSRPPAFFDPITGSPLLFHSGNLEGGYLVWDAPGFDPDSREPFRSIDSRELRDEILANLRPVEPSLALAHRREPKRLEIRRIGDIRFVDQTGRSVMWYHWDQEIGYELYDAPGYHRTGHALIPVETQQDRDEIVAWFKASLSGAASDSSSLPGTPSGIRLQEAELQQAIRHAELVQQSRQRVARGEPRILLLPVHMGGTGSSAGASPADAELGGFVAAAVQESLSEHLDQFPGSVPLYPGDLDARTLQALFDGEVVSLPGIQTHATAAGVDRIIFGTVENLTSTRRRETHYGVTVDHSEVTVMFRIRVLDCITGDTLASRNFRGTKVFSTQALQGMSNSALARELADSILSDGREMRNFLQTALHSR